MNATDQTLTPLQRRYAHEFLDARSKYEAALRAGYSPTIARCPKDKIESPAVLAEIARLSRLRFESRGHRSNEESGPTIGDAPLPKIVGKRKTYEHSPDARILLHMEQQRALPTFKQKKLLDWILNFQMEKGYSPSLKEIAEGLNLATATVHAFIVRLERKGTLIRDRRSRARNVIVLARGGIAVRCPYCARDFKLSEMTPENGAAVIQTA